MLAYTVRPDPEYASMTPAVRLARRVADMMACSRREAEMLVEGGWVRVNGQRVETPQTRVSDETIEIDPQARPEPIVPVTLVLHKPAGCLWDAQAAGAAGLLALPQHWPGDPSGVRPVQRHLLKQEGVSPLERDATGLLVFTQ